eukprot:1290528-Prymnesium_polylepis.2
MQPRRDALPVGGDALRPVRESRRRGGPAADHVTRSCRCGGRPQVLAEIMKDKETFWMSRKEYDEMGIDALLAMKCSM